MTSLANAEHQLQAMDSIIGMLPIMPFDDDEASFMLKAIKGWREQDGRGAVLWCAPWEAAKPMAESSPEEKLKLLRAAMSGGWMPLWLVDQASEFLIFKVSKGRGLFGDKKSYHLYMVGHGGQPVFNSEYKTLLGLVSKVGTLYR
ncbi:hypothetical protein [Devosia ginsengisoli]|uniref:Uncharacterized protein n=1 Tax=Devosia ginsengisoli TaxID=400770 RepID=A0A5B8LYI8_9HYPH|nr:hypothetical protein [Devosia ginsengisoli]QDZ13126.1 hypothetical protein FPZ08_21745 [Devosia ginsengisoli]